MPGILNVSRAQSHRCCADDDDDDSDDDDDDDQMALIVGLTVSFGVVTLLVVGMAVVMMRGRAQARRQLKATAPAEADAKKPSAQSLTSTEMIDVQKVPPQMHAA